jgi:Holliday junction resolvasome RuvABC endonuclease subunit
MFYELPLRLVAKRGRGWGGGQDNEAAVDVLRGLIGIASASAARAGVKIIQGVEVQDARKAMLGRGRVPAGQGKYLVMERCRLLGWDPATLDESDAMAIWSCGCAMVNPRLAPYTTPLFAKR